MSFSDNDRQIIFEIEDKYKIHFYSKPFYESLLAFYKKTKFLTDKQVEACKREITYIPYTSKPKRKYYNNGYFNNMSREEDTLWAMAYDLI